MEKEILGRYAKLLGKRPDEHYFETLEDSGKILKVNPFRERDFLKTEESFIRNLSDYEVPITISLNKNGDSNAVP